MQQPLTTTGMAVYFVPNSSTPFDNTMALFLRNCHQKNQKSLFQTDKRGSKGLTCSPECQLQSTFLRTKNRVWQLHAGFPFGPMENLRKFPGLSCMFSELQGTECLSFLGSETCHHAFHLGHDKIRPNLFRNDLPPMRILP